MRGSKARDSKLRNLRMTLSKLDAKYSKSSVLADEEDSDYGDDMTRQSLLSKSLVKVVQVEPDIVTNIFPEQHQQLNSLGSSEQILSEAKLQPESAPKEGSIPVEDISAADTVSSIESIKTESLLGFNNVHSVSSLADSILISDKKLERNSTSLITAVQKSQPKSPSASSLVDYGSIISQKGKNMPANSTSSSSLKIQKQTTQSTEETVKNIIDPIRLEATDEPLEFLKQFSPANSAGEQSRENNAGFKVNNSIGSKTDKKFSPEKKFYQSKSNEPLKPERKSIGVQTHDFLGCQELETTVTKTILKGNTSATFISESTPVIKATKLPHFFDDVPAAASNLHPGKSGSIENELSLLTSHHLHLTKEFLERQHRMYLANCKAVQLLEKGYKENMLDIV